MHDENKILGLIGARSGSKGVKDKNIRLFCGEPLIARIISCAKQSEVVDRVIVSTDSSEYAEIAKRFGAEVPFLRPNDISQDHSSDIEYFNHALEWLNRHEGYCPDLILRLLPTVPFQNSADIDKVVDLMVSDKSLDSAVVVAKSRVHAEKCLKLVCDQLGNRTVVNYIRDYENIEPLARQTYPDCYVRANIVATRLRTINKYGSLTGKKNGAVVIPQARSIDIDTELDFLVAEYIANNLAHLT